MLSLLTPSKQNSSLIIAYSIFWQHLLFPCHHFTTLFQAIYLQGSTAIRRFFSNNLQLFISSQSALAAKSEFGEAH